MRQVIREDGIYTPSDNIVAREIEGELIIIPLIGGIADVDEELFSLSPTGYAIWIRLDGKKTVEQICSDLAAEYNIPITQITPDVCGFLQELFQRQMLCEIESTVSTQA